MIRTCPTCGDEFETRNSRPSRFCKRKCVRGINSGDSNGMWSGGSTVTNRGYRKVVVKGHPRSDRDGYVLEHIVVVEKGLGRYLNDNEVVHHLDHNKLNNKVANLLVFGSQSDHIRYGHGDKET